ncbi:hypothetical protein GGU11DRAFT_89850 [Lentinula aff. detonsa]|nr:hypothetical protein GGU11DRAFT_89850 [Lentinula aff. detonsa]
MIIASHRTLTYAHTSFIYTSVSYLLATQYLLEVSIPSYLTFLTFALLCVTTFDYIFISSSRYLLRRPYYL